jgi:hypothetical protein
MVTESGCLYTICNVSGPESIEDGYIGAQDLDELYEAVAEHRLAR